MKTQLDNKAIKQYQKQQHQQETNPRTEWTFIQIGVDLIVINVCIITVWNVGNSDHLVSIVFRKCQGMPQCVPNDP